MLLLYRKAIEKARLQQLANPDKPLAKVNRRIISEVLLGVIPRFIQQLQSLPSEQQQLFISIFALSHQKYPHKPSLSEVVQLFNATKLGLGSRSKGEVECSVSALADSGLLSFSRNRETDAKIQIRDDISLDDLYIAFEGTPYESSLPKLLAGPVDCENVSSMTDRA